MIPDFLTPLANHIWQSTLFGGVAGLLTLMLRKNRAGARYWLWLTASIKFLIPFSLLVALGGHIEWRTTSPTAHPAIPAVVEVVSHPFIASPSPAKARPARRDAAAILWTIWGCGFIGVGSRWWWKWRRVKSAVRGGSPLHLDLNTRLVYIPVVSSRTLLEPGIFGIFRPVLLVPEGILARLTPAQLLAMVAHELCHLRRRDNLTGTLHMLVEAIFWFHPLVWWIGTRLLEERERACDEEVLLLGNEPRVYAQTLLKVCEFYVESPVACVAGVTGANLKRRIEAIMKNRTRYKLNFVRKVMLSGAASTAVVGPLVVGMLNFPSVLRAQSTATFEVASIKAHNPADRTGGLPRFLPGGKFTEAGLPLNFVIAFAYNLPFQGTQLSGGPGWIRSPEGVYDIEAKANEADLKGLPPEAREARLRTMVQALLAERFKLVIRRETREQPVYVLTVGKNGPRLQKSRLEEKDCYERADECHVGGAGQGRGIHVKASSMADLVMSVSGFADRPLLDRTGLKGLYDIDTDGWVPMRPRPPRPPGQEPSAEDLAFADPARPTLYAIFEKLGLKMESSSAPVEMFVIDHVEKPTEN